MSAMARRSMKEMCEKAPAAYSNSKVDLPSPDLISNTQAFVNHAFERAMERAAIAEREAKWIAEQFTRRFLAAYTHLLNQFEDNLILLD